MSEYTVEGTLTLRGVKFTVDANSMSKARAKAKAGEWTDYDTAGAEALDWRLNPNTAESNE